MAPRAAVLFFLEKLSLRPLVAKVALLVRLPVIQSADKYRHLLITVVCDLHRVSTCSVPLNYDGMKTPSLQVALSMLEGVVSTVDKHGQGFSRTKKPVITRLRGIR